ncbi:MAG: hypothetical protein ACOYT4_04095 [Nanoarchaeota archaeon]
MKQKSLGIAILIFSIIALIWTIAFSIFFIGFGLASEVDLYQMVPLIFIVFIQILLIAFIIYFSLRLIKNKPLRKNKILGLSSVMFGIFYFVFELIYFLKFREAWLRPIIAFIWGLLLVLVGIALKNYGNKNK